MSGPVTRRERDGTPPRAWGRQEHRVRRLQPVRNTPTCVGTTAWDGPFDTPSTEHPHVRGDDGVPSPLNLTSSGTPPRAWGRPERDLRLPGCDRNTPTCVGTTAGGRARGPGSPEHPHVRGDDPAHPAFPPSVRGTPPRAWGRRSLMFSKDISKWNTPTCVGTTAASGTTTARSTEHPHVRGDDATGRDRISARSGTPPRAWGRP